MCVPSTSGMSETAACPPSPIANAPSAPPSPTSYLFLPLSNSFLFTQCQPLNVLLYFSRYYKFKMFSLFFVFTLMYYSCEKNYKPTVAQYYITDSVGGTPKLTLLGL